MFRTKVPQPDTSGGAPPKGRSSKCSISSRTLRKNWGGEGPNSTISICWFEAIVGFSLGKSGETYCFSISPGCPYPAGAQVGAALGPTPNRLLIVLGPSQREGEVECNAQS